MALALQVLAYDSYTAPVTSLDKRQPTVNGIPVPGKLSQVPIIRVYSKLPSGHTCLVHVHDVFPYIYVRYFGAKDKLKVREELIKLKNEIEFKLHLSLQRKCKLNPRKRKRAPRKSNDKLSSSDSDEWQFDNSKNYIADLSLVRGIPFYGYHLGHTPFVKISLANPKHVKKLTKLLHEGKIFNKFIQPFESHVPYTLQFLTDYNLFSMECMNLDKIFFRYPLVQTTTTESYHKNFKTRLGNFNKFKINKELENTIKNFLNFNGVNVNIFNISSYPRVGRTVLEIDTCAKFISNRRYLNERDIHSGLFEAVEESTGYFKSTKGLWDDVKYLRGLKGLSDDESLRLFEGIKRKNDVNWENSQELKNLFNYCLHQSEKAAGADLTLENIEATAAKGDCWCLNFPTSFQSVEQLWNNIEKFVTYKRDLMALPPEIYLERQHGNALVDYLLKSAHFNSTESSFSEGSFKSSFQEYDNDGGVNNDGNGNDNDDDDATENDDEGTENDDDINGGYDENEEEDMFIGTIPHLSMNEQVDFLGNQNCKNKEYNTANSSFETKNFDDVNQEENIKSFDSVKHDLTHSLHDASVLDDPDGLTSQRESLKLKPSDYQIFIQTQKPKIDQLSQKNSVQNNNLLDTSVDSSIQLNSSIFLPNLNIEYPDPFYSRLDNYDSKPFYFAGKKYLLPCKELENEPLNLEDVQLKNSLGRFQFQLNPPTNLELNDWAQQSQKQKRAGPSSSIFDSQIKGPSAQHKGFKYSSINSIEEHRENQVQKLIMLTIEIHVSTRGQLFPDPVIDEIDAIFWKYDGQSYPFQGSDKQDSGIFINSKKEKIFESVQNQKSELNICLFDSELEMVKALMELVEITDPDILSGFELNSMSWGYIIERFRKFYDIDLTEALSRVILNKGKLGDSWGIRHASGIRINGRHLLNVWRHMRNDITLNNYTFENIVFQTLHLKIPKYKWKILTAWWRSNNSKKIGWVLNYWMLRVDLQFETIKKLETIEKISEQSRLLGCDFYSMIYRGSQYKVECLLVRLAKEENFILISPSKKQVFNQDSLECIPLVMEPQSGFYKSPLVVLDFQSLYPSIIIAYNICYSTYLGRLQGFDPNKYTKSGITNFKLPLGLLKILENDINITPNGMMFAKSNVRKSLLSKMLAELLDLRIFVKGTMSSFENSDLKKLYNNRQLAIKLIANVTYGYTSASFSGRMPHSGIADAIVSCGRQTLINAIESIESESDWGAKVVYGDTDSLFVYLPGKSKSDAFKIGKKIASKITKMNPDPIKLKFEKVYFPSVLLTKKRYIGWSFEGENQLEPKFDAKGIETIRRDGIPAQGKILEKSLNILFKDRDISLVKDYVVNELQKIVKGNVNIKDFIFARKVRIGTYKNEAYIPPGARLGMAQMEKDHRNAPQYKERVTYVVRKGNKSERLQDKCLSVEDFLMGKNELDDQYYIDKVLVPPLERVFNLIGVDVRKWVSEMPKKINFRGIRGIKVKSVRCPNCGKFSKSTRSLCDQCQKDQLVAVDINRKIRHTQSKWENVINFCENCSKKSRVGDANKCVNEDCKVYFDRIRRGEQVVLLETELSQLEW